MLGETEVITLQEGVSVYDVEPIEGRVSSAAHASLVSMPAFAVPAIIEALPSATETLAEALWEVLDRCPVEQRIALPDDAHAVIESAARRLGAAHAEHASFEGELARRVRTGEVAGAGESFWRAWLAHPTRAHVAVFRLVDVVADKGAYAREVAAWLEDPTMSKLESALCWALERLPGLLPPETAQRLAASELPKRHHGLVPLLAAYGWRAAALIPQCFAMLDNEPLAEDEAMVERHLRWERATRALVDLVDEMDSDALRAVKPILAAMAATRGKYGDCGARILEALNRPTWEG
jgi:hypothetical protein